MSPFNGNLHLVVLRGVKIKDKPFIVDENFGYTTEYKGETVRIEVPSGYRTDFASIPRFFWRIFPPDGPYRDAAVVHDWLCDAKPKIMNNVDAANIFALAMEDCGVPSWKRTLMARMVKWFGPKFKQGDA
jgi:hypothetical protein